MMFKIHLIQEASLTVLAGRLIFASSNVVVEKCIFFSNLHKSFIKERNESSKRINTDKVKTTTTGITFYIKTLY
jgi:hypothetical protein